MVEMMRCETLCPESSPAMNKRQLIEAIQTANPSATERFLQQFDADSLQQYLNRLEDAARRAPKIAAWVRPVRRDQVRVA